LILEFDRAQVVQHGMRIQGVVRLDTPGDFPLDLIQAVPLGDPAVRLSRDTLFFQGPDDTFGVGVAFRVIVRRKGLFYL